MNKLADQAFKPHGKNEVQVDAKELDEFLKQLPDWEVMVVSGEKRLQRVYKFKNFVGALAFTNQVGELAESEDHHPSLLTEWGKVTVTWWTHVVNGLHKNDFIMAARTDRLYLP